MLLKLPTYIRLQEINKQNLTRRLKNNVPLWTFNGTALTRKYAKVSNYTLHYTLEKMYNFVSDRFDDPGACVQEQALQWLQVGTIVLFIKTAYITHVFSLII